MRYVKLLAIFLLVLSVGGAPLNPQSQTTPEKSRLTVERIFDSKEFSTSRMQRIKWLTFMDGYSLLAPSSSVKGARDILYYNVRKGKKEVMLQASLLIPAGKKKPLVIDNYTFSRKGKMILIFTNSKRVWRRNTRGDYWILDRSTKQLRQLGGDAPPSSLMFAKFSPDEKWIAYVRGNNIYAERMVDGEIRQLTRDGDTHIINGTFDWVYEEEFGLRDGFRWSPDSRYIAFWQLNSKGIKNFYMINNTDGLYPSLIPVQYPKVGTTNSACRIGVVTLSSATIKWIEPEGDSRQHYIARMDWAASSNEIIFQRLNRAQNTIWLTMANIHSGKMKVILTEKDEAWLDVVDDLKWLQQGKYFTWISERSGWRHIYLVTRSGNKIFPITAGKYDVINLHRIDEKKGWIYFIASPDNPAERYLYRISLTGKAKPQRLTPKNNSGSHQYNISANCKWALHTYSNYSTPPTTSLIKLPSHTSQKLLVSNQEVLANIRAIKKSPVEFFRLQSDEGVVFDAWCIKPPDFSPENKYPLLFYVYGEPAGQTVLNRWFGRRTLWHWLLAQHGYVIMSVDNRGTPSPRGRNWRKSIYKKIGVISSQDQAGALKAILTSKSYVDPQRVGIWGWSGGGSMTLNMMFRYPDLYKTGVAIAFVANQELYDTIYQERYMGLLPQNRDAYKQGSPITFAHQLKGNLLLIHGTGDDNVHYQNCERLVNELIKHKKQFQMMAYPNRSHGIYEGKNTTLHLYTLMTRYLLSHLPPGPIK